MKGIIGGVLITLFSTSYAADNLCGQPLNNTAPTPSQLTDFANSAVLQTFTYDHNQMQTQLKSIETCYTKNGWNSYQAALKQSGNMDAAMKEKFSVVASPNGNAKVLSNNEGQDTWKIAVPIKVKYENATHHLAQDMNIKIIVGIENDKLGIEQIIATAKPQADSDNNKADTGNAADTNNSADNKVGSSDTTTNNINTNSASSNGSDDTNNASGNGSDDTNSASANGSDDTNSASTNGNDDTNSASTNGNDDTNSASTNGNDDTNSASLNGSDDTNSASSNGNNANDSTTTNSTNQPSSPPNTTSDNTTPNSTNNTNN